MTENNIILLVEDNPEDAAMVKSAFEKAGLTSQFLTLYDGEQAMQYLSASGPYADRSRHPFPHLILLDLKMPRVSGLELLAWLRCQSFGKDLPVIIITESSFDKDITEAYHLGAKTFLTKPFEPAEFATALKHTANYWFHGTKLPTSPPFAPPPSSSMPKRTGGS